MFNAVLFVNAVDFSAAKKDSLELGEWSVNELQNRSLSADPACAI